MRIYIFSFPRPLLHVAIRKIVLPHRYATLLKGRFAAKTGELLPSMTTATITAQRAQHKHTHTHTSAHTGEQNYFDCLVILSSWLKAQGLTHVPGLWITLIEQAIPPFIQKIPSLFHTAVLSCSFLVLSLILSRFFRCFPFHTTSVSVTTRNRYFRPTKTTPCSSGLCSANVEW